MIINSKDLLSAAPIKNMETEKLREHGVSYGLSEAGYDIRLKQNVAFIVSDKGIRYSMVDARLTLGRFCLASAMEEFDMPTNLVGIVHDKSTNARRGLSVFNTVIEPGWKGFLTLELVYHGQENLTLHAGQGIAQVIFHQTKNHVQYEGRYQNQADEPVADIRY